MIEYKKGIVFFSPKTKRFLQVRNSEMINEKIIHTCSGFCRFYSDCQTTITTQRLSDSFLKDCIRVDCIDEIEGIIFNGIGWRHKDLKNPWD